jgi:hypothetical protein
MENMRIARQTGTYIERESLICSKISVARALGRELVVCEA